MPTANLGLIPQTHGERLVPKKEASLLQSLDAYNQQAREAAEAINAFHVTPYNQRDLDGYRQALLNGMSVSADIESGINSLQIPPELSALARLAGECASHSSQAYSSYLDYLATGRRSDNEKANHFLGTANEKAGDYQAESRRYLDNGYKHEVTETGVQYWHSK